MNEEETKEVKTKTLWNMMSLKTKLIVIGSSLGFFFIVIFICVIIAPLMEIGVIDIGKGGPNGSYPLDYSDIGESATYWWPIGSADTRNVKGVLVADGLPVSTTISSYFGNRKDPFTGVASNHSGTDIAANDGSVGTINIIAAKEGTVIYPAAGDVTSCPSNSNLDICGGGYGNYVMIEHGDGTITLYSYCW